MRIAYDHQVFAQQRFGGISRYFVELAANLISNGEHDVRVIAPFYQNEYLADPRIAHRVTGVHLRRSRLISLRSALRWGNRLALPWAWRGYHPEIVHETYFSEETRGHGQVRVVTVYDMIHELYPQQLAQTAALTAAKRAAVKRADHVICISECTRRDLVRLFDVPPEKTSVVYLGHSLSTDERALGSGPVTPTAVPAGQPFILYVGERPAYKNFNALAQAYARSARLRTDFRLVAFGGKPFSHAEHIAMVSLGIADRCSHAGGGDELLAAHYRAATLFVCPSRYEGFGLPPLEAMAYGCPVACSRQGSLLEVVGDAGELFDPDSVDAMSAAMERVAYDASRRMNLIERGRVRALQFTWSRCAEQTAETYQKLLAATRS